MGPMHALGLKETYLANREAELKDWDAEIMQFEAQAEETPTRHKIPHDEQLESLRTKQAMVREKLKELKQASGPTWETAKISLENAWNDLKDGLLSTAAKYK